MMLLNFFDYFEAGSALALLAGAAIGGIVGFGLGVRAGHGSARSVSERSGVSQCSSHESAEPTRQATIDAERALRVLQAEYDRLNSAMAQRAARIAALENELRSVEDRSALALAGLQSRFDAEKTAHETAIAEARRIGIEQAEMQARATGAPGLQDRAAQLMRTAALDP